MSEQELKRWPAVMVDLETLGTSPKAAVIEIGAVCFDLQSRTMGPRFEARVNLESNGHHDRAIEPETLAWWMDRWRQSGRVPDLTEGKSLEGALWEFSVFWAQNAAEEGAEFWSRGSFDERILQDLTANLNTLPWEYWNVRDQRTVTAWAKRPRRAEVAHSALEDALAQVEELFACLPTSTISHPLSTISPQP
jgi:hypothetical protein